MRILLTFAWLLLAASLSAQPLRFTALTTNRTMVTFTNGEVPVWNGAANQWSNGVATGQSASQVSNIVLTVNNFNAAHTFHLDWLYGNDATAKPDDIRFPWRTPTNWIAAQRTYINNGTNYLKGTGRPGRYEITNFSSTTGGPLWFSPTNVVWDLAGVEFFQTVTNECNTLILTNIDHFSIKGLTMRSTRQSGTTNDRSGLLHGGIAVAGRIKGWELDGVTMTNWTRHCITPLFGTINEGASIRQCYFIKYGATNTVDLGFDGQAIPLIGNMQVEGCHFYDGTRGLETEGFSVAGQNSGGATVRGCTFKRISEAGVLIIPDFIPTAYFSVLVENNYFDGVGVDFPYAIVARGGLRHRVLYNYITDYYTGIQLEADATFHLLTQVIGNQVNFTDRPIIVVDAENEAGGVAFCDISRNVITTGVEFGMNLTISDSVISDNIILDSGGDGLVLSGNTTANDPCVRNIVRGNLIGVNDEIVGDGIEIGASVRDIRLENNVIGAVNGVPLKKNGATNISELWHTITGVGIGTIAPLASLHVVGGIAISNAQNAVDYVLTLTNLNGLATWKPGGGGTNVVSPPLSSVQYNSNGVQSGSSGFVFTNGNVGIGTNAPQNPLHVVGASPLRLDRAGIGAWEYTITPVVTGDAIDLRLAPLYPGSGFLFQSRNDSDTLIDSLAISDLGNVGIGTNAPNYRLDIFQSDNSKPALGISYASGAGNTTAMQVRSGDGTTNFSLTVNGIMTLTTRVVVPEIRGPISVGTDIAGADFVVGGGLGTGSGRGGSLIFQTSTNGPTGSVANQHQGRIYVSAKAVPLTESTATLVFSNSLAVGKWVSIKVFASTHASDGTDFQVVSEVFTIAAVNKAGTITTTVSASAPSATQQSSGTLTTAWTAVANGNGIDVKNNAVSSLTQTTLNTQWRVEIDGNDANLITPQ